MTSLSFGLAGRRAIVTGHKGGIGAAIAGIMAADGAEVIVGPQETAPLVARVAALPFPPA